MTSVLGLARLKGNSQKIVGCYLQLGFKPKIGQAVSAVQYSIQPMIIPFNGDFFGIVTEVQTIPARCSVTRSGQLVAVLADNIPIAIHDKTYFNLVNGYLTDNLGVPVGATIKQLDEPVYDPVTGVLQNDFGALIDLDQASTISGTEPLNDFKRLDFLAADFA